MPADRPTNRILLPYSLATIGNRPLAHWLDGANLDLSAGFFQDSALALPKEERHAAIAPLESLAAVRDPSADGIAGVIYHCSRCGSTLLCQMLKQRSDLAVAGEPSILGQILESPDLGAADKIAALRGVSSAFSRWGSSRGKRVVFKLTSWNLNHWRLVEQALPLAPKLLLFREPRAVLRSLALRPPNWLRQRNNRNSASLKELAATAADSYVQFASSAAEMAEVESLRFIGYSNIDSALPSLLAHFDLSDASDTELQTMVQQRAYYAKSGTNAPQPYSETNDTDVTDIVELIGQRRLDQAYDAFSALLKAFEARRLGTVCD